MFRIKFKGGPADGVTSASSTPFLSPIFIDEEKYVVTDEVDGEYTIFKHDGKKDATGVPGEVVLDGAKITVPKKVNKRISSWLKDRRSGGV